MKKDFIRCLRCAKEFYKFRRKNEYCSAICENNVKIGSKPRKKVFRKSYKPVNYAYIQSAITVTPITETVSVCKTCNKEFVTLSKTRIYCLECQSAKNKSVRSLKKSNKKHPIGYYVYAWYHPKGDLPFYIGMGEGNRAWDRHQKDNASAECQKYRNDQTKIIILRESLTLEGALLIESVLIQIFSALGAYLTNKNDGMKRKEVPPLEIPQMCDREASETI